MTEQLHIWAIRSLWSEPQSAPALLFAYCIELLHLWLKKYNQFDFSIEHLVMSMCRVFSCVVGRGCLVWPVHSLGKTLLAFALLISEVPGQICLLLQVFLDFLLLHSSPLEWKGHLFWVLVLWRPTRTFRTNTQKRCPFHYRGLECKSRKSRNTWSSR